MQQYIMNYLIRSEAAGPYDVKRFIFIQRRGGGLVKDRLTVSGPFAAIGMQ